LSARHIQTKNAQCMYEFEVQKEIEIKRERVMLYFQ
jgi:hypothetical protein